MDCAVHDGFRAEDPEAGSQNSLHRRSCNGSVILRRYECPCLAHLKHPLTDCTGGLLPLIPYFIFSNNVHHALFLSIGLTGAVLLAFGYVKAKLTGTGHKDAILGAIQTLVVGGIAAGAAYGIVRAVNSSSAL